ncbi:MAG TPA: ester cyclase [Vicinamibacterales bacterium]|nr:ester cyclase [Vicinamibacterales bacterium]
MTREEITALFTQRQEAWTRRDIDALVDGHSEDSVLESPLAGGHATGREAILQVYQAFFHAFPDIVLTTDDLLIDGDRVVLIGRLTGTDLGGFMGMAPTGRSFDIAIVTLFDLSNGLITRERRIYDFTGLLVQVGTIKAKPV